MFAILFVLFSNFTNEQNPGDCDLLIRQMILLYQTRNLPPYLVSLVSVYNTAKKFLGHKLLSVILLFIYLFLTGQH